MSTLRQLKFSTLITTSNGPANTLSQAFMEFMNRRHLHDLPTLVIARDALLREVEEIRIVSQTRAAVTRRAGDVG